MTRAAVDEENFFLGALWAFVSCFMLSAGNHTRALLLPYTCLSLKKIKRIKNCVANWASMKCKIRLLIFSGT